MSRVTDSINVESIPLTATRVKEKKSDVEYFKHVYANGKTSKNNKATTSKTNLNSLNTVDVTKQLTEMAKAGGQPLKEAIDFLDSKSPAVVAKILSTLVDTGQGELAKGYLDHSLKRGKQAKVAAILDALRDDKNGGAYKVDAYLDHLRQNGKGDLATRYINHLSDQGTLFERGATSTNPVAENKTLINKPSEMSKSADKSITPDQKEQASDFWNKIGAAYGRDLTGFDPFDGLMAYSVYINGGSMESAQKLGITDQALLDEIFLPDEYGSIDQKQLRFDRQQAAKVTTGFMGQVSGFLSSLGYGLGPEQGKNYILASTSLNVAISSINILTNPLPTNIMDGLGSLGPLLTQLGVVNGTDGARIQSLSFIASLLEGGGNENIVPNLISLFSENSEVISKWIDDGVSFDKFPKLFEGLTFSGSDAADLAKLGQLATSFLSATGVFSQKDQEILSTIGGGMGIVYNTIDLFQSVHAFYIASSAPSVVGQPGHYIVTITPTNADSLLSVDLINDQLSPDELKLIESGGMVTKEIQGLTAATVSSAFGAIGGLLKTISSFLDGDAKEWVSVAGNTAVIVSAISGMMVAGVSATGVGTIVMAVVAIVFAIIRATKSEPWISYISKVDVDGDGLKDDEIMTRIKAQDFLYILRTSGEGSDTLNNNGAFNEEVKYVVLHDKSSGKYMLHHIRRLSGDAGILSPSAHIVDMDHTNSIRFVGQPVEISKEEADLLLNAESGYNGIADIAGITNSTQINTNMADVFGDLEFKKGLGSREIYIAGTFKVSARGDRTAINAFNERIPPPVIDEIKIKQTSMQDGYTTQYDIDGDGGIDTIVTFGRPRADKAGPNDLDDGSSLVISRDPSGRIISAMAFSATNGYGRYTTAGRVLQSLTNFEEYTGFDPGRIKDFDYSSLVDVKDDQNQLKTMGEGAMLPIRQGNTLVYLYKPKITPTSYDTHLQQTYVNAIQKIDDLGPATSNTKVTHKLTDLNGDGISDRITYFGNGDNGNYDGSKLVSILDEKGNVLETYAIDKLGRYKSDATSTKVLKNISKNGDYESSLLSELFGGDRPPKLQGSANLHPHTTNYSENALDRTNSTGIEFLRTFNKPDKRTEGSGQDWNFDGQADTVNVDNKGNITVENLGKGDFKYKITVSNDGSTTFATADVDGDGKLERFDYDKKTDTWTTVLSTHPEHTFTARTSKSLYELTKNVLDAESENKKNPSANYEFGTYQTYLGAGKNGDGVLDTVKISTNGQATVTLGVPAGSQDKPITITHRSIDDATILALSIEGDYVSSIMSWVAKDDNKILKYHLPNTEGSDDALRGFDFYRAAGAWQADGKPPVDITLMEHPEFKPYRQILASGADGIPNNSDDINNVYNIFDTKGKLSEEEVKLWQNLAISNYIADKRESLGVTGKTSTIGEEHPSDIVLLNAQLINLYVKNDWPHLIQPENQQGGILPALEDFYNNKGGTLTKQLSRVNKVHNVDEERFRLGLSKMYTSIAGGKSSTSDADYQDVAYTLEVLTLSGYSNMDNLVTSLLNVPGNDPKLLKHERAVAKKIFSLDIEIADTIDRINKLPANSHEMQWVNKSEWVIVKDKNGKETKKYVTKRVRLLVPIRREETTAYATLMGELSGLQADRTQIIDQSGNYLEKVYGTTINPGGFKRESIKYVLASGDTLDSFRLMYVRQVHNDDGTITKYPFSEKMLTRSEMELFFSTFNHDVEGDGISKADLYWSGDSFKEESIADYNEIFNNDFGWISLDAKTSGRNVFSGTLDVSTGGNREIITSFNNFAN